MMEEDHKKLLEKQNKWIEKIYDRLGWAFFWLFIICVSVVF